MCMMAQSTGVFLVFLRIITAATAGMTCAEFKRTLFNEEIPSILGMSFIVLVEEPETELFWDNICAATRDVEFNVTSSSKGINAANIWGLLNGISVMKETGIDVGTIILTFSEQVTLGRDCDGMPLCFHEDSFLPLDSLGKEYFIVLPKVNASEYLVRLSSIHNDTDTVTTISGSDEKTSDEIIRKHIDIHETFTIQLKFDFTGSRILATYTIAVFYSVLGQWDFLTVVTNLQLPPAGVFGNTYYIVDYMTIAVSRNSSSTLRLTAMHDHTTVISSHSDKFELNRGVSFFLKVKNRSPIYELNSEKRFIVSNTHIIEDRLIFNFFASTDQYFTSSFIIQNSQQSAEFIYSSVYGPIDMNVTLSNVYKWGPTPVPYSLQILSRDSNVTIWGMTIDYTLPEFFYIYIQSAVPLDGIYKFSGGRFTKAWGIFKSQKGCRLVEAPDDSCMGTCNYTLKDSCDMQTHENKTETPKDIVTMSAIAAATTLVGLGVVTGRRVHIKARLKKRVNPTVQSESQEI